MQDIESIKKKTAQSLRDTASQVLELAPTAAKSFHFNTSQLTLDTIPISFLSQVSTWATDNGQRYIYYFRVTDASDLDRGYHQYEKAKKDGKGGRAYARLNQQSEYLYVGSSQNVALRTKEHLGYGSRTTYAMQLAYWAHDLAMDVEFRCIGFPERANPKALQALEDGIWEELNPMLGRQGAK
jgi:hypothetical protein